MLESAAALLGTTGGEAANSSVSGIFEGEPLPTLETRFRFGLDNDVLY
jgi:hypothetical protein